MKVIAIADGYYINRIIPFGTEFEAAEGRVTKPGIKRDADGNTVYRSIRTQYGEERVPVRDSNGPRELAAWLIEATPENRKLVEDLRRTGQQNAKAAALAAAGPKRSRRGFSVAPGAEESAGFAVDTGREDLV